MSLPLYYEDYSDIRNEIAREKQLKNWKREWKIELTRKDNPDLLTYRKSGWRKAQGQARG